MRVYRSRRYKAWFRELTELERQRVDARIDLLRQKGELKDVKRLDRDLSLFEFKWRRPGMRVYFSLLKDKSGHFTLPLTGGNKNTQSDDIAEAKRLILKALRRIKEKRDSHES